MKYIFNLFNLYLIEVNKIILKYIKINQFVLNL